MNIRIVLCIIGVVIGFLSFITPEWILRAIGYLYALGLLLLALLIEEEEFRWIKEGEDYED